LKKILVTGANGFLGRAVTEALLLAGFGVLCVVRRPFQLDGASTMIISDLESQTDWACYLAGVDCIVHTAARAHIMNDTAPDPLGAFRKVNVTGTLKLAEQAAKFGVKRFIFISSIKVNGESTVKGWPFTEKNSVNPQDAYGLSKIEAEQGLLDMAKKTSMEVVIIRPPLVYGPGVRANFAAMMKWVKKGIPLPFGAIRNQRSLVALDNLVSFIIHCIDHPKAANETFLVSDGEDVSTTQLLQKTAKALGKTALLIPVPVSLMSFAAKLMGKVDVANRLFGSLQVDSSKARELLGWKPVITMDGQLKKLADAYLNEKTV
jgi:nucleoside-diphosphate-sugar epimerase